MTAEQDYIAEISGRGYARPLATLGEIWSAEWAAAGLQTFSGVGTGRWQDEAYDELAAAIASRTGRPLTPRPGGTSLEARLVDAEDAIALLPEEERKALEPLRDVRKRAAEKAQAVERQASELGAVTYGMSGTTTAFLAGVARHAVDPFNLATMPLGGPLKGPVLRMLGREAAIGAVTQAAQEPVIQGARAELGLEAGLVPGLTSVGEAAIGAAGIAGLFRGAAAGYRYARGGATAIRSPVDAPAEIRVPEQGPRADFLTPESASPAAAAAARDLSPEDFDAAAMVAERDALIAASAPADMAGRIAHAEQLEARAAELETGRASVGPADDVMARLDAEARQPTGNERLDFALQIATSPMGIAAGSGRDIPGVIKWSIENDRPDIAEAIIARAEQDATRMRDARPGVAEDSPKYAAAAARLKELADEQAALAQQLRELKPRHAPDVPEAEIVTVDMTPRKPAGPAARDPATFSLFEFLASKGGLAPHPDLDALFGGVNPFVPGFGKLIRKDGLKLDRAREAATESKYILDAEAIAGREASTDTNTLLDMIGEEAGGSRQYIAGEPGRVAKDDAGEIAVRKAELVGVFDLRMRALGVEPLPWDDTKIQNAFNRLRDRSLEIMAREGEADPLLAYERALLEHDDKLEARRRARQAEHIDIPGWDVPDDGRAARGDGGGVSQAPAERSGDGVPGGPARAAGEGAEGARRVGNPAIANDAERALIEYGDNLEITMTMPDGSIRRGPARELMDEAQADADAVAALIDCLGLDPT